MAADDGLSQEEAGELEKILEGGEGEGESGQELSLIQKIKSKPMLLIAVGVVALLLLGAGGAAVYFFAIKSPAAEKTVEEETSQEYEEAQQEEESKDDKEKVALNKAYVYKMKPFFLPLLEDGQETGKFIVIQPNLLLSNFKLNKEIERSLPLIRKNIYTIIRRKSPKEIKGDPNKIKETLKSEIVASANTLLLGGTGTISDVFFSQFIIK